MTHNPAQGICHFASMKIGPPGVFPVSCAQNDHQQRYFFHGAFLSQCFICLLLPKTEKGLAGILSTGQPKSTSSRTVLNQTTQHWYRLYKPRRNEEREENQKRAARDYPSCSSWFVPIFTVPI